MTVEREVDHVAATWREVPAHPVDPAGEPLPGGEAVVTPVLPDRADLLRWPTPKDHSGWRLAREQGEEAW